MVSPRDGKVLFILKCSHPVRFLFWDFGQLGSKEDGSVVAVEQDHCRVFFHNWKANARLTPTQDNLKKDQYKGMCTPVRGETEGREYQLGQNT